MGAGGVIIPPKLFCLVQPVLKKNNILFIADKLSVVLEELGICGEARLLMLNLIL